MSERQHSPHPKGLLKMASFINNVIVRTKGKEKHDEIVEEVVIRLVENDLYIKPKK